MRPDDIDERARVAREENEATEEQLAARDASRAQEGSPHARGDGPLKLDEGDLSESDAEALRDEE